MANDIEIIDLTSEPNQTIDIISSDSEDETGSESPYRESPQSQPTQFQQQHSPLYSHNDDDDVYQPQIQSQPLPPTPKIITTTKRRANGHNKHEQEIEKKRQQLLKQANKANAAAKALENCRTIVDKNVLSFIGDPDAVVLKTLFDESMIKYSILGDQKIPNSITWTYKRTEVDDIGCVELFKDSPWMIIIMEGKEYLERILAYRDDPEGAQSIKKYLSRMRDELGRDIIFMVYNLANYLKNERVKDAKQYRKTFKDRFEGTSNSNDGSSAQAEESDRSQILALGVSELQDLRLMLEVEFKHDNPDWKFHIEFFEKTNDIINSLVRYSLSMAKLEVVRSIKSSTGLDWAINMDKEKACDPTKDLTKLWITQLQQFSQVTLPIAKCIASEYPSPCSLIDQYRNLTHSEAESLLGELYVQRNLKRQIGPSISKRIHCFFTCEDPDVHIGLG